MRNGTGKSGRSRKAKSRYDTQGNVRTETMLAVIDKEFDDIVIKSK
jgi:hypothetical protein